MTPADQYCKDCRKIIIIIEIGYLKVKTEQRQIFLFYFDGRERGHILLRVELLKHIHCHTTYKLVQNHLHHSIT
jgi:hypothetical protein